MALTETVTDIIVARAQHTDRLSQMIVWSIAGHAIVIARLFQTRKRKKARQAFARQTPTKKQIVTRWGNGRRPGK